MSSPYWEHTITESAISLRDYFAAAALTGVVARLVTAGEDTYAYAARIAYAYADAMIKEREENNEQPGAS